MIEDKQKKRSSILLSSPVIGAIITSIVAIAIAFGTRLVDNNPSVMVVVTATSAPAEATEAAAPTSRVQLLYDATSFTVHNGTGEPLSLEDVVFQGGGKTWEAIQWGNGVVDAIPAGTCVRLKDLRADEQDPPAICDKLYSLQLIGPELLFWVETPQFEVLRDDELVTTCVVDSGRCDLPYRETG